jgi:predicted ATPase
MFESLRLERFKNFRDATLPLGPLTIVVGTNASGKTNLRDAFRFVHGMGRGYSLADILGDKYGPGGELQWKGTRGGTHEVAMFGERSFPLTTRVADRTHRIEVEVPRDGGAMRVVSESLHKQGQLLFKAGGGRQKQRPSLTVFSSRNGRDGRHAKPVEVHDQAAVYCQLAFKGWSRRIRQEAMKLVEAAAAMRFLDLSPETMKLPSLPGQNVLGDRGENLSSVLHDICQHDGTRRPIMEWLRELTPLDVVEFEFAPDAAGRILLTLVESNGQRTSAYSASDGTLRFLGMLAAFFGRTSSIWRRFYFFEEIDHGIHPARLYLLLQLIEQEARRGNCSGPRFLDHVIS